MLRFSWQTDSTFLWLVYTHKDSYEGRKRYDTRNCRHTMETGYDLHVFRYQEEATTAGKLSMTWYLLIMATDLKCLALWTTFTFTQTAIVKALSKLAECMSFPVKLRYARTTSQPQHVHICLMRAAKISTYCSEQEHWLEIPA